LTARGYLAGGPGSRAWSLGSALIAALSVVCPGAAGGADQAGTAKLIADVTPGPQGTTADFYPLGSVAFFRRRPADSAAELWRTDGTAQGTFRLPVVPGKIGGSAHQFGFATSADWLFLVDFDGNLWRSDGSAAGTRQLTAGLDLGDLLRDFPIFLWVESRGLLFFRASDPLHGGELWASDGTPQGTRLVKDLEPGVVDGWPRFFAEVRGKLVFRAGCGTNSGDCQWTSDGTAAGTTILLDQPARLATSGSWLVFLRREGDLTAVWRTDGSEAGTGRVAELPPGAAFGSPFAAGGRAYFLYDTTEHGRELWTSDGTAVGTRRLTDFANPDTFPFGVEARGVGERTLFGVAGPNGGELWATDGTPEGTRALVACPEACGGGEIQSFGSWAVLGMRTAQHGRELWRTDGTPEGTHLVADVCPGPCDANLAGFAHVGDVVFFFADDGVHGVELWWSNGTPGEAHRATDFAANFGPLDLVALPTRLVFRANTAATGQEPWTVEVAIDCDPQESLCLRDGRFRLEVEWRDHAGGSGQGRPVRLTPDTGYFWFFDAGNVEVVAKVLDGRSLNGHFWLFYGALSDVAYELSVTDLVTGLERRYRNPAGTLASVGDTRALLAAAAASAALGEPPPRSGSGPPAPAAGATDGSALLLGDGRFELRAEWVDFGGHRGSGQAVQLTSDSGYFWFFDAANVEVVSKVLDGRGLNGHFWVFYGSLSSVEFRLSVTDTVTGATRTYLNPSGHFASRADTAALPAED
jgi:ELWxxDGT repeat protein